MKKVVGLKQQRQVRFVQLPPPPRQFPKTCAFGTLSVPDDPNPCGGHLSRHHIRYRSEGGTNDPCNLITLCRKHHDWVHSRDFTGMRWGDESFAYLRERFARGARQEIAS